jgi:feruloyl esterase
MLLPKLVVPLFIVVMISPIAYGAACEDLKSLSTDHMTITLAQVVPAGEFSVPSRGERTASAQGTAFKQLPAFCRVAATLKPSTDSNIKMELWMPLAKWNEKFQAVGNGGWAGAISYMGRDAAANGGPGGMASALQNGYATASTDTGHDDAGAQFALGHPEKLIDYAYRAVHETTITSKAILSAFYGAPPKLSYFNGCSTGGRQALVEAQRYPEDFDGILAGAAANPKTHLDAWRVWMAQAMFKDDDSYIPATKYSLIHEAVLGRCDALDGVKDGLIENPLQCHFDPAVLQCKGADGPQCLTKPQVAAAQIIMVPARDRHTGRLIFPGFETGNELGWGQLLRGPGPYETAADDFKYVIFGNPN